MDKHNRKGRGCTCGLSFCRVVSPDLTGFIVALARWASANGIELGQIVCLRKPVRSFTRVRPVLDLRSSRVMGLVYSVITESLWEER